MSRTTGVERVQAALASQGIASQVRRTPASTRTAGEAAAAVGCQVAQIVKSLLLLRDEGEALLVLVGGDRRVDLPALGTRLGTTLRMSDPDTVRALTGFAIGGVAPLGSSTPLPVVMDPGLLRHEQVWAAAGAPNAVFEVDPQRLRDATEARVVDVGPQE